MFKGGYEQEFTIINCCPHDIIVAGKLYPRSEYVARCSTEKIRVGYLNDVDIFETRFTDVIGLPDPQPWTRYIVSRPVFEAINDDPEEDRYDLVCVGELIRDETGRVIGAKDWSV